MSLNVNQTVQVVAPAQTQMPTVEFVPSSTDGVITHPTLRRASIPRGLRRRPSTTSVRG